MGTSSKDYADVQNAAVNKRARKSMEGKELAPQVGFEPTTLRLTAECSTIELLRSNVDVYIFYLIRASRLVSNAWNCPT
jgi:hypothetical protein